MRGEEEEEKLPLVGRNLKAVSEVWLVGAGSGVEGVSLHSREV